MKTFEPVLLLGQAKFSDVDIRIRVKGGGFTSQIYAIRQAIAKSLGEEGSNAILLGATFYCTPLLRFAMTLRHNVASPSCYLASCAPP